MSRLRSFGIALFGLAVVGTLMWSAVLSSRCVLHRVCPRSQGSSAIWRATRHALLALERVGITGARADVMRFHPVPAESVAELERRTRRVERERDAEAQDEADSTDAAIPAVPTPPE